MRIGFFIFPGFQLLDMACPLTAFEVALRFYGASEYRLETVSLDGGSMPSSSGVLMHSERVGSTRFDTLIVPGGDEMVSVCSCQKTLRILRAVARGARRVASVCIGSYALAAAGLLDGKAATTHWRYTRDFQKKFPRVRVQADRIFVRDDPVWTSAGVTAGIDLALAMIAEDYGDEVAQGTAKDLVVFYRRPGGQPQQSALLKVQANSDRVAQAIAFAREHLSDALTIETLAEVASLSPRQFARVFREETGRTPAKVVESLRVEAARVRVEDHHSESLAEIARATGFNDLERMRRAFIRAFGQSPQDFRRASGPVTRTHSSGHPVVPR